jgi:hypothetical protein
MQVIRYLPLLIIIVLAALLGRSCAKQRNAEALVDSLNAKLIRSKDELGRNVATIQKIQMDHKSILATKDSALAELRAEIKRAGKKAVAVTIIKTVSEGKASGATIKSESVLPAQTDSIKIVGVAKNPYFEAKIEATPDSVKILNYKLFNEFIYTETTVSGGFLKPRIPVVSITANQGTSVTETKAWHVKTPKQYKGLYILGGFVLGAYIASVF